MSQLHASHLAAKGLADKREALWLLTVEDVCQLVENFDGTVEDHMDYIIRELPKLQRAANYGATVRDDLVHARAWWDRLRKAEKMEALGLDIDLGPMNWAKLDRATRWQVLCEWRARERPV